MKKVILFWIIILGSMWLIYAEDDDLWWLLDIINNTEDTNNQDTSLQDTEDTNNHSSADDKSNLWNISVDDTIDNTVYNLIWYIKWKDVYVYYIPWNGVKNVKISYSYDNINYVNLITLSAVNKYYHFPVNFSKKQIYIKVLPVTDSGVGVIKEWVKTVPYITISLSDKKIAKTKIWYAKTWPELWILFVIFVVIYWFYRYKKI